MPQALRVAFLMEDLCFGGTQRQMLELARRLDRGRFTPVMLTLTGPTDLDALARKGGIELHHLGRDRRVAPLFFLRLGAALRRLRPDVLVPCTALPNIWGRIWGRLAWPGRTGAPLVLGTCRGGGGPVRQHERWLWRLADQLVCNSQALRAVLEGLGVPSARLHYIPNGVDTEFFAPADPPAARRAPLILCVARLAGDKDHLTLLRAFALVLARHPEARLRLVGDGPEEARLRRWAAEHAAGARVEFVPGGLDMREHYAAARLFALASVREGQPNVLLEAMACGLPVCATAVGGVPRLVEEGATGLLCPAGDAAALAENCCRLLEDDACCARLGDAGRGRAVRDFSFARMVAAHEALMDKAPRKGAGVVWRG
ncbi:glycosyltransferase [Desulfovibrio legallii]|uniref:Glycosyltransferase involved in cell wall bisynthesis n=1 Tax=Desulfovibrio legallii TaxID=571438 RepID=A0A1G7IY62_9BACT|nr:glycosyltransferase [Desulfovibrio legallii]SDF17600.1 Glycosyltransferase involved in cell wall bisynthesis [Desulfovibrio legallii]